MVYHYATSNICALSFSNKGGLTHFHSLFGGVSLTHSATAYRVQDTVLGEGDGRGTKTLQSCFWDVRD